MARFLLLCFLFAAALTSSLTEAGDDNRVYSPCSDSTVAVGDGFTFGIAFAARASFFGTNRSVQYSPCDRRRLSLSGNSELAVFRPKVDEITLLTINTSSSSSSFRPVSSQSLIYGGVNLGFLIVGFDQIRKIRTVVGEFQLDLNFSDQISLVCWLVVKSAILLCCQVW